MSFDPKMKDGYKLQPQHGERNLMKPHEKNGAPSSDGWRSFPSVRAREALTEQMCEYFDIKPSEAAKWIYKISDWATEEKLRKVSTTPAPSQEEAP